MCQVLLPLAPKPFLFAARCLSPHAFASFGFRELEQWEQLVARSAPGLPRSVAVRAFAAAHGHAHRSIAHSLMHSLCHHRYTCPSFLAAKPHYCQRLCKTICTPPVLREPRKYRNNKTHSALTICRGKMLKNECWLV